MKSDKPFRKSFTCAGVLFAIIVVFLIVTAEGNLSYRTGYAFSTCLFPALVSGTWGFFSKKSWSWGRFAGTVLGFYVLFGVVILLGKGY